MQWTDSAIIIGARRHGEHSAIVEAFTQCHGRHFGIVRGARSPRLRAVLVAGNEVRLTWRARLEAHLGSYSVEPVALRGAEILASPSGVFAAQIMAEMLRLLPERDPHPSVYEDVRNIFGKLQNIAGLAAAIAHFDFKMLRELGFGLDLDNCAATGTRRDLIYVSPKSGRAVSRDAGAPYAKRLLPLPAFFLAESGFGTHGGSEPELPPLGDIQNAFALTEFFLFRHVWEPRQLPNSLARTQFLKLLSTEMA